MVAKLGSLFLITCGLLLVGCAEGSAGRNLSNVVSYAMTAKPNSVESMLILTPEEEQQKVTLSEPEQAEALNAMQSVAAGRTQTRAPQAAPHGVRWRDVPVAVHHACREVELAIVRTKRCPSGDQIDFTLSTVDDRPATLTVLRLDDERVYEAHATVGRFGHDVERAALLLEAFHESMLALGQKRGFD